MAWRITVPDDEGQNLRFLLNLSVENFERLAEALGSTAPTFHVGTFARRVLAVAGLDNYEAAHEALINLNSISGVAFNRGESLDRIASDVSSQLARMEGLSTEDEGSFRSRLFRLLSIPNVSLVSQAFSASFEGKNLYERSSVSTELGPLYSADIDSMELLGGAVFHELLVSFSSKKGDSEFTCRLDYEDLFELRNEIDRALARRESLQKYIVGNGLRLVSDSTNPSDKD